MWRKRHTGPQIDSSRHRYLHVYIDLQWCFLTQLVRQSSRFLGSSPDYLSSLTLMPRGKTLHSTQFVRIPSPLVSSLQAKCDPFLFIHRQHLNSGSTKRVSACHAVLMREKDCQLNSHFIQVTQGSHLEHLNQGSHRWMCLIQSNQHILSTVATYNKNSAQVDYTTLKMAYLPDR